MASEERVIVSGSSGEFAQKIQIGKHQLIGDEPLDKGGMNLGPDPYEYLLASLGTCTSMTVSLYARTKKWPLQSVEVHLRHFKVKSADLGGDASKLESVDHIEREMILVGELTEEQRTRLLEIANRCPIYRTLQSKIEINSQLV